MLATMSEETTKTEETIPIRAGPAPAPVVIYEGPVSLWMGWKSMALAVAMILVGIGAALYSTLASAEFKTPLLIGGIALLLASGIMLAYVIVIVRLTSYKITNKLIQRETGLLIKRTDALDLARVKDVQLTQSVLDRMVGIGTIEVFSTDRTDPAMYVEALPGAKAVYEKLRDAVIEISQRRGVVPMT